jgi:hypothetical protein
MLAAGIAATAFASAAAADATDDYPPRYAATSLWSSR